jgi:DeoR/GlpR family transcriptional regulator of sugar metabolism
MLSKERQRLILDYITAQKSVQVHRLRDEFNISTSTLRRDLIELERSGQIARVHGGAVLLDHQNELPIRMQALQQAEEKKRIGEAAALLVDDGDTILITGGTTTDAMLPFLAPKEGLTVITNSISCAYTLTQFPHIDVVMLGGWLRHAGYSVHGPLTESGLTEFHPTKVFHGIFGICVQTGLTGINLQEVQTDRHLISIAPELIILADHTKFCRKGTIRLATIAVVSKVISDLKAPQDEVRALQEKGIEVTRV